MATHSEEEARTCAFLAVKIVVKERLELVSPATLEKLEERVRAASTSSRDAVREAVAEERQRARRARPVKRSQYKRPADAPSRTSYASACLFCEEALNPGDKVFYSKIFEVMVCPECFEAEILVKKRMDDLGEKARGRQR
jgi:hypothetical protein